MDSNKSEVAQFRKRREMVIRGGENIFPREVEEFLVRHPTIADAQVLSVPDAFFGEELKR